MTDWQTSALELRSQAPFVGGALGFCIAHYGLGPTQLLALAKASGRSPSPLAVHVGSQLARGALMALCGVALSCLAELPLDYLTVTAPELIRSGAWVLLGALVALPLLWLGSRGAGLQRCYPELRLRPRTPRIIGATAAGWVVFLFGYELLFRGLILHQGVSHFGLWAGVGLSSALYALAHMNKDASETLSSFVAGPAFAVMTIDTGGIWAAVLLHAFIAIASENLAAHHNPWFRGVDPGSD
jgi:membrane protease YdiL (CAAX protease family)